METSLQHKHASIVIHARDFWFARGAVVVVVVLQLLLENDLSFGGRWLAPIIESLLLIPLSVATAWVQGKVRNATSERHYHLAGVTRRRIRELAIVLTALITIINLGALFLLLRALLGGHAGDAKSLLVDAVNVWSTNVIAFALWYWSIDRGGPAARGLTAHSAPDFLFTQMTMKDAGFETWSPGFIDYLFLSFTNATAFSPTDTFPLSGRAKLLMMANAAVSLLTLALVAARAVNILA